MKKISIIIPVYKVEKYIEKCLDSVVNQTLKDIEIIVVNDGSPDDSQKIIDKYKKKDKRIKSFIKENGGLSDARNFGVKKATGEYIAFLDSDDSIREDMLELMYNKAISKNFDVVVCDVEQVYENSDKKITVSSNFDEDLFSKEEVKKELVNLYPSAWNKIYKRSLLTEKYNFKKGVYFEDVEFAYRFFTQVETIGVVKEPLIYYLKREGAITAVFDKRLYHYIDNWNGLIDFYKDNNLYDEYYSELEFCYVRYLYATFIKSLARTKDFKEFKKGTKQAIDEVNKHFPNYGKNKYLKEKGFKNIYLKYFALIPACVCYQLGKNKTD